MNPTNGASAVADDDTDNRAGTTPDDDGATPDAGAATGGDETAGTDTGGTDAAGTGTAGAESPTTDKAAARRDRRPRPEPEKPPRQVSISLRTLAISGISVAVVVAMIGLIATLGVFISRDISARNELSALQAEAADAAAAEEVAGRYAVAAATLDYQDLTTWIAAMKDGVSPDLQKKYDVIGQAMEQLITPLRMQTTAELVLADTTEANGDLFRVDAVVNVNTKSVQTPDGGSAVAVYTVTLDRSQDWLITEVGDPTGAIPGNLGPDAPAPADPAPADPAPADQGPPAPPAAGQPEAPAPSPGG